jgi:hypothetical protein
MGATEKPRGTDPGHRGSLLHPNLTYGNVVGTMALFVALSGSAYAALRVPPNSVGNRQLKAGSVTTGKIANAAITAAKVAEHSLTGTDVDLAALGTVPQAANAQNASNANAVGGHAATCPQGTTLIRGLCFDSHSNPEAPNLEAAALDCAAKGGYLPTPMQLYSTQGTLQLGSGLSPSQHQFTDTLYSVPPTNNSYTTIVINGSGLPTEQPAGDPSAYYCVYPLVR